MLRKCRYPFAQGGIDTCGSSLGTLNELVVRHKVVIFPLGDLVKFHAATLAMSERCGYLCDAPHVSGPINDNDEMVVRMVGAVSTDVRA